MNHTTHAARTQSHALLPIPTADTFGACSTLFELGGMIVIHDPSGCNSTYTTHDEPRWYHQDALLFISALTEYDAILGRDDKLIHDIETAAEEFHPSFICILPSQIAHLIATDLPAISRIIQRHTGLPPSTLPPNSMHSYDKGIEYALEHLARHLVEISSQPNAGTTRTQGQTSRSHAILRAGLGFHNPRVNLLGLTPLDFHWQRALPSLKSFLTSHRLAFAASLTLSTTLEEIAQNAPVADVNLVLAKSALPAAHILEKGLGIPYIAAVPYPPVADEIAEALRLAAKEKKSRILYEGHRSSTPPSSQSRFNNFLLTEHLAAASIQSALAKCGHLFSILSPPTSEPSFQSTLTHAALLISDPLYFPLAPVTVRTIPLPHRAISSRTFEKKERNLLDQAEWAAFLKELQP